METLRGHLKERCNLDSVASKSFVYSPSGDLLVPLLPSVLPSSAALPNLLITREGPSGPGRGVARRRIEESHRMW